MLEPWRWADSSQGHAAKHAAHAAQIRCLVRADVLACANGQVPRFSPSYGQACEDLLDWLGGLHLGLGVSEGDLWQARVPWRNWIGEELSGVYCRVLALSRSSNLGWVTRPGEQARWPGSYEHTHWLLQVLLWTMGESLLGPSQIRHTLQVCQAAFAKHAAAREGNGGYLYFCFCFLGVLSSLLGLLWHQSKDWFLLSMWGSEDAPISHHGGAHGFDYNGAHHAHLLCVRGRGASSGEEREGPQGLLIEGVNALDSAA